MPTTLRNVTLRALSTTNWGVPSLFAKGEEGVWYDPSDMSTMFQDAAGSIPVTGYEQPVGLILDKSKGLALGNELVTNGGFDTDTSWTKVSGWTISGGRLNAVDTAQDTYIGQAGIFSAGKTYLIEFERNVTTGTIRIESWSNGVIAGTRTFIRRNISGSGVFRIIYFSQSGGGFTINTDSPSLTNCWIDNVSVKELPGNHAFQSTTASRPVLSARYNQLTYSEQFDNAAWLKTNILSFGSGSVTNATTAPNGTTTADLIVSAAATDFTWVNQYYNNTTNASHTFSVYVKSAGVTRIQLLWNSVFSSQYANFNLSSISITAGTYTGATITDVGNGWRRCTITSTIAVSNQRIYVSMIGSDDAVRAAVFAGDGTSGIYIWGADLRVANDGVGLPVYQRVGAAVNTTTNPAVTGTPDYDTVGFPPYLRFDGVDDTLRTTNINLSTTDKVTTFLGLRKLSDAADRAVLDFGPAWASLTGSFGIYAPSYISGGLPANKYSLGFKGTGAREAEYSTYIAPITNTLTFSFDIGATGTQEVSTRINNSIVSPSIITGDAGTGNFGNYQAYIGSYNGNFFWPGRLYQLIIRGAASTTAEITATEAQVNQKTKAY